MRLLKQLPLSAALVLVSGSPFATAAQVTLSASDDAGFTSFNTSLHWSNAEAPSAANDYVVSGGLNLRTPADSTDHTFAGNSLTISASNLIYKGLDNVNIITIPHLILDGSLINSASNTSTAFTLAGNVTISGTATSVFYANNNSINVTAGISGNSGTLEFRSNGTQTGRQIIFSGNSSYTGNILITGVSGATFDSTSVVTFKPGANGVCNKITGTSAASFDGTFVIDLSSASNTVGDSWVLVDASTLAETYSSNFSVQGFEDPNFYGYYTSADGRYQFNTATGVLTRIETDTDADGLPDSWEIAHFGTIDAYGPNDDPDNDHVSNLAEYQAGTDPNDRNSFPDADGDGLPDPWEKYYFPSLSIEAVSPSADPDGDFSTNMEEFLAGTDPTNYGSFPDENGNSISDGWESHYFPSVTNLDPEADADGDGFTNSEEFWAKSDPTSALSSPDTDLDGLPDAWEIMYFGAQGEDRDTAISHYGANDDPDGDGFSNKLEFIAGTNPADASSVPNGTFAYWSFEEKTSGSVLGDSAYPGGGNYENAVLDSSVFSGHLRTYSDQTAPAYTTDVPFSTVPSSQATNTASLYFDGGTDGTSGDVLWTQTGKLIRAMPLKSWTVELSFKLDTPLTGANQGILAKDGNPLGGQPPFHIKYLTTGHLEIGLVDANGTAQYIVGASTIEAGTWYTVAATGDSSQVSLWVKKAGETSYTMDAQSAVNGSFYNYTGYDDAWALGRARWNGGETDWFKGWVDEVRITGHVLTSSEFLAASATSGDPYTTWAEANIADASKRGQTDDADGDGTSNYDEYRLGLNPSNGSSRFAATISNGSSLSWPAASGLSFTIQRSTSLAADSWVNLTTVTATGSTQTWSDPNPPAGKAFYRVMLNN